MPSPFAHAATGYILYRVFRKRLPTHWGRLLSYPIPLLIIISLSLLPDLDAIPGILSGDMARFHNNITHSLVVGLAVALIGASVLYFPFKSSWIVWFGLVLLSYELHIIMDFFTGERGSMLFWPFTAERFSAPVKLFTGVKWGLGLFSPWHLWTLFTEGLFFMLIWLVYRLIRKNQAAVAEEKLPSKEQR